MIWIRRTVIVLLLASGAALAWLAWHPVTNHSETRALQISIPPPPAPRNEMWQVVSRRFIREEDARAMKERLRKLGLHPEVVASREQITWAGFSDPYSYPSTAASIEAQARWRQAGIDSTVLHDDRGYHLLLGRFSSEKEIAGQRLRLQASGLRWQTKTHTETAVVWRLRFAPAPRADAEVTWRLAQQLGGLDPLLERIAPATPNKSDGRNAASPDNKNP